MHRTGTPLRTSFHLQPVLKGEILELRPPRDADFDDLFAATADPLTWEQHPNKDRHKEEQFRIFFGEALVSGGALIATDARDGRVNGLLPRGRGSESDAEPQAELTEPPAARLCSTQEDQPCPFTQRGVRC